MKIELELWHLISMLLGIAGMFGALGRVLLSQIDKRLDSSLDVQATLLRGASGKVDKLERDFLEWRAELPIHYVRREDYVRGQTVIEAKLDALYNKLEVVQMKGNDHG